MTWFLNVIDIQNNCHWHLLKTSLLFFQCQWHLRLISTTFFNVKDIFWGVNYIWKNLLTINSVWKCESRCSFTYIIWYKISSYFSILFFKKYFYFSIKVIIIQLQLWHFRLSNWMHINLVNKIFKNVNDIYFRVIDMKLPVNDIYAKCHWHLLHMLLT